MIKQILAIFIIFLGTTLAWAGLSATMFARTYYQGNCLEQQLDELWGSPQVQVQPSFWYQARGQSRHGFTNGIRNSALISRYKQKSDSVNEPGAVPVIISGSKVDVKLDLDYRKKGLLWYSTYNVRFSGAYTIENPTDERKTINCTFTLPTSKAIYDNLKIMIDGKLVENLSPQSNVFSPEMSLSPHETTTLSISYDSRGLDKWSYSFGTGVQQVKDFLMTIQTNFDKIDFPSGCMSPSEKGKQGNGWILVWRYNNLLTGSSIGITMPAKLNPGPWVTKVTFFAPVSLFLFFFIIFMLSIIKGIRIHPMNYFFIAAGFFSFHLLLAYLVDRMAIEIAFLISSIVSVFLVVSYMRKVVSDRFAYFEIALAQFVYLILFSSTFFFEEFTGLAVTIMSIATLYIIMQLTGKIDWYSAFEDYATRIRHKIKGSPSGQKPEQ